MNVGRVTPGPLFVRLWPKEIRLPDLTFCYSEHIGDRRKVQDGADLVIEVVSEGEANRKRDIEEKPVLYAKAGISEYWIVDPEARTITVLRLVHGSYEVTGEYRDGGQAASVLLPGFNVNVSETFAAGEK